MQQTHTNTGPSRHEEKRLCLCCKAAQFILHPPEFFVLSWAQTRLGGRAIRLGECTIAIRTANLKKWRLSYPSLAGMPVVLLEQMPAIFCGRGRVVSVGKRQLFFLEQGKRAALQGRVVTRLSNGALAPVVRQSAVLVAKLKAFFRVKNSPSTQMIAIPPLSTKAHALLIILGEGALLFVVSLIGAIVPWFGKPVSTKRYIALCAICITIWVLIAAGFALKG